MKNGDFYDSRAENGSQFWKRLHKVKHLFKWGAIYQVGDGRSTKFWHDVWQTTSHLRVNFHKIFSICEEPNMSVAKGAELQWQMGFRGVFGDDEMEEWTQLQALVEGAIICGERDTIFVGARGKRHNFVGALT
jgi:hypothetical protein